MLKLNASFSKKVPAEEEYSSQSYHAAVEVELPDGLSPEQLRGRIHETFDLVRNSVESELHGAVAALAQAQAPHGGQRPAQRRSAPPIEFPPASGKQLGYLRDMAVRQGYTPQQLDEEARRRFGVADAVRLNRQQASELIDELGGKTGQRQRRAA